MRKITLYIQTLKYLRLKQLYYRLRMLLGRWGPRLKGVERASVRRTWSGPFLFRSYAEQHWQDATFTAFGVSAVFAQAADWAHSTHAALWLYHLHYLDDLAHAEIEHSAKCEIWRRWSSAHPPFQGLAWDPYPVSLRLVNMVKFFSAKECGQAERIAVENHLLSLSMHIEYHLMGNHLLANAKALIFGGAFLDGDNAHRFLKAGLQLLDDQLAEQMLADGGHFERSPMYHAIIMWDICDLLQLAITTALPALQERMGRWQVLLEKGIRWLRYMSHADGQLSFFNDAAFSQAPALNDIQAYAGAVGVGTAVVKQMGEPADALQVMHLRESGYIAVACADDWKLLFDAAPIGPDYQPGHAHADTLSFELSFGTDRLFVNTGTSHYAANAERAYQRSTQAHNTVVVGGKNSSAVWSSFRVAQRAYPKDVAVLASAEQIQISAAHTGYRKNGLTHRRQISLHKQGMIITDRIEGRSGSLDAVSYLHLHPDVEIISLHLGELYLRLGERQIKLTVSGAQDVRLCDGTWHPRFGESIANKHLEAIFAQNELVMNITWESESDD